MRQFSASTLANAYSQVARKLITEPDHIVSPREQPTYEIRNAVIEITNPYSNFFENEIIGIDKKYISGELYWYFSGRDDLEFISKYSKFWEKIANTDGTCNSAYGKKIFIELNKHNCTEWNWAATKLLQDKNTRQAIIRFNKPDMSYEGNKDFTCTLFGIFQIRDNKLYLTIEMRSQDWVLGARNDFSFFLLLMQIMKNQLIHKYPDLELGTYTHIVNSLHLYERNLTKLQESLKYVFFAKELPRVETGGLFHLPGDNSLCVECLVGEKLFDWIMENKNLEPTQGYATNGAK